SQGDGPSTAVPPTEMGTITAPTRIIRGEPDVLLVQRDQEALAAPASGRVGSVPPASTGNVKLAITLNGTIRFAGESAGSVPCAQTDEARRTRHRARAVGAMPLLCLSQRAGGEVTVEEQAVICDHQWS